MSWLHHSYTARSGGVSTVYRKGDLNLGFTAHDDAANVRQNRAFVLQAFQSQGARLITLRQVHGREVLHVRLSQLPPADCATAVGQGDALITTEPGLLLGIQVADCVPLLLADPRLHVVAAAHAGWRGTAAGIVEATVASMVSAYGSRPADLVAAVGPSIGSCCYIVGDEVRTAFHARYSYADQLFQATPAGIRLDLWHANRLQLLESGLEPSKIHIVGECTACTLEQGRSKYFSHRAEHGFTGRAMGVIGIIGPQSPSSSPPAP